VKRQYKMVSKDAAQMQSGQPKGSVVNVAHRRTRLSPAPAPIELASKILQAMLHCLHSHRNCCFARIQANKKWPHAEKLTKIYIGDVGSNPIALKGTIRLVSAMVDDFKYNVGNQ
jgi:hypothetical protein